jgi:hypothetical protein
MLGRGGFSEVWKALDLVELREVAVKVRVALHCTALYCTALYCTVLFCTA